MKNVNNSCESLDSGARRWVFRSLLTFEPKPKPRCARSSSEAWVMGREACWTDPGLGLKERRAGAPRPPVHPVRLWQELAQEVVFIRSCGSFVCLVLGMLTMLYFPFKSLRLAQSTFFSFLFLIFNFF